MTDGSPQGETGPGQRSGLTLAVGCEFHLETPQPVAAVVQVAPCRQPGVRMQRQHWYATSDHHGYVDRDANCCERFVIESGSSRIAILCEPDDNR